MSHEICMRFPWKQNIYNFVPLGNPILSMYSHEHRNLSGQAMLMQPANPPPTAAPVNIASKKNGAPAPATAPHNPLSAILLPWMMVQSVDVMV